MDPSSSPAASASATATKLGVDQQQLDAVWNYQTSPLFSAAERAALDVSVAAGCVPNAVIDEMFMELRKHWSDDQVVEIVGVIEMFGFLNRWTTRSRRREAVTRLGDDRRNAWR